MIKEHVICNLGVVGSNPTRGSKEDKEHWAVTRVAKWG